MTTLVDTQTQLHYIEQGLRLLKGSELMKVNEFKGMCKSIEKHHVDVKLAHLTGTPSDLMKYAIRDTKFYHILTQMLSEVVQENSGSKRKVLRSVHNWYLKNQHTLYQGPVFGKAQKDLSARSILRVNEGLSVRKPPKTEISVKEVLVVGKNDVQKQVDFSLRPDMKKDLDLSKDMPKKMVHPISSLINPHASLAKEEEEKATAIREYESLRNDAGSPIKIHIDVPGTHSRISKHACRNELLRKWSEFQQAHNYGQDVLGKLNLCGRNGTPMGVRYSSHEGGEMPENYTQQVISSTAQTLYKQSDVSKVRKVDKNLLSSKSLEEFYEFADKIKPDKSQTFGSCNSSSIGYYSARSGTPSYVRSRPSTSMSMTTTTSEHARSHSAMGYADDQAKKSRTDIKLDTVVNMLDSVSGDMSHYREQLTPTPQSGFRSASAFIPSHSKRPHTAPPCQRANSPEAQDNEKVISQKELILIPDETSWKYSNVQQKKSPENLVMQAIDWRGRITPDSIRYKWGETKFGGHTFVKSYKKSMRTQGRTSAGQRPKTAPINVKERWKTDNESDDNSRVLSQAASHVVTEIKEEDFSSMVRVHALDSGRPRPPSESEEDIILALLKQEKHKYVPKNLSIPDPPKTYLTLITPKTVLNAGQGPSKIPQRRGSRAESHTTGTSFAPYVPYPSVQEFQEDNSDTDHDAMAPEDISKSVEEIKEDLQHMVDLSQQELYKEEYVHTANIIEQQTGSELNEVEETISKNANNVDGMNNVNEETPALVPSHGLMKSQYWSFSPSADFGHITFDEYMKSNSIDPSRILNNEYWFDAIKKPENYCTECRPKTASARLGPGVHRKQNKCEHILQAQQDLSNVLRMYSVKTGRMLHRQQDKRKRILSAPLRTAPSIPSVQSSRHGGLSPRTGQTYDPEIEHHAPKTKSPRRYINSEQKMKILRSSKQMVELRTTSGENESKDTKENVDNMMSSLQVLRLDTTRNQESGDKQITDTYAAQLLSYQNEKPSINESYTYPDPSEIDAESNLALEEQFDMDNYDISQDVVDDYEQPNKPTAVHESDSDLSQHADNMCSDTDVSVPVPCEVDTVGSEELSEVSSISDSTVSALSDASLDAVEKANRPDDNDPKRFSTTTLNISSKNQPTKTLVIHTKIPTGRPIPQVGHVPDPDKVNEAVKRQQEIKAAVDIQRIFRGYVARNQYKYLVKEDRERSEDQRKAAIDIQRVYRGHLARKDAIYNRKPDSETLKWAQEYKMIQLEAESERKAKQDFVSRQNSVNKKRADTRLSIVGPHVDMYQVFHPKKVGPNKDEIILAATTIQKMVRGWSVRRHFEAIKRKSKWHGGSWKKFIRDYNSMLCRIQHRYGIERPQTPFDIQQVNRFMDLKKRFESVFDRRSFGGELEEEELVMYFKECDLYPTQSEIEDANTAVFRGKPSRKNRGFFKNEIIEITFQIYVPEATGLQDRRRSTWMNPIIDGEEARKFLETDQIDTPLKPCMDLVTSSIRERRERGEVIFPTKEQRKQIANTGKK